MSHFFQRVTYGMMGVFMAMGLLLAPLAQAEDSTMQKILIQTNMGNITIALDRSKAPATVDNFLDYVKNGFYNNTLFHRVIPGFMVQGGGFTTDFQQKPTNAPVKNEANNGLKNVRGSIAMARTSDPNSATAQFFINLKDNAFLDYTGPTPSGYGYAVFGQVVDGMDVVDKIAQVKTGAKMGHQDVPMESVVINSVTLASASDAKGKSSEKSEEETAQ